MSITKFKLWLGAFLMLAATVPVAQAQIVTEAENAPHTGPFIEPDTFKSDLQFFAPAEIDDYSGPPQPNVGFYFQYQYMTMALGRPRFRTAPGAAPTDFFPLTPVNSTLNQVTIDQNGIMDIAVGNRWNFGWVSDDGMGWHGAIMSLRSPNVKDETPFRMTNFQPWHEVRSTMNDQTYQSYEINRSLFRSTGQYGGIFEPFVGVRYHRIQDDTEFRSTSSILVDSSLFEENWLQATKVSNEIFTGQIGFRHTRRSGHWQFASECKFFAGNNYQRHEGNAYENFKIYTASAGGGTNTTPVIGKEGFIDTEVPYANNEFSTRKFVKNEELFWGGQLDLDANYQITKYISFNVGSTFLLSNGAVGRSRLATYGITTFGQRPANFLSGSDFIQNNNDYIRLGGVNFGININR
jgi:hypothetical protein